MKHVVLGDGLPAPLVELLGGDVEIVPWDAVDADRTADLARVEAIVAYGHPTIDGPLMDRLPALRIVSNHGVGVDHVDVAAATARGIPVGNTPGCLDAATADLTLALLLAAARNVVRGDRFARGAGFTHFDPSILIGREVTGASLGIVGMGRIGRQVARRAAAFDMRVRYCNRRRNEEAERTLGVTYAGFDELLAECEFVSLNCPLTPQTTGLMSTPQFRRMRSDAILVNTSRGAVVDTQALYTALVTGEIAAAGIDVTDPEPLPRDHPLLTLENVVVTPHLGSASDATRRRMMEMTIENLRAGLARLPLPYRVN